MAKYFSWNLGGNASILAFCDEPPPHEILGVASLQIRILVLATAGLAWDEGG